MGVWIETHQYFDLVERWIVTPHVGVWIETSAAMPLFAKMPVTPHVGVWIETIICENAVVRECHSPCGSVD